MARKRRTDSSSSSAAAESEVSATAPSSTKAAAVTVSPPAPVTEVQPARAEPSSKSDAAESSGTDSPTTAVLPNGAASEGKPLSGTGSPTRSGEKRFDIPEGLSKTQKKNLRNALRDKERKALERAGLRRAAAHLPTDPLEAERKAVLTNIQKKFSSLPHVSTMKTSAVVAAVKAQTAALDDILGDITDAVEVYVNSVRKPDGRRQTSAQLLATLKELQSRSEKDEVALDHHEEQLKHTVCHENAKKMLASLNELKDKIEERTRVNHRAFEAAREWEKKLQLVDRVKALKKNSDGPEITHLNVASIALEVTPDALNVLLPPLACARRLERAYGVIVERSPDRRRPRFFTISGLDSDVAEVIKFLKSADFSGKQKMPIDPKLLPALIGKGGSGIRQLEDDIKCFLQCKDSDEVVVYGYSEQAAKVKQHIASLKIETPADRGAVAEIPVSHPGLARGVISRHMKAIREIEGKQNVSIRVNPGPPPAGVHEGAFGADLSGKPAEGAAVPAAKTPKKAGVKVVTPSGPSSASIVVRGQVKELVAEAKAQVENLIKGLTVLELEVEDGQVLRKLFGGADRMGPRAEDLNGPIGGGYGEFNSVGQRFAVLRDASKVAFLRHGDRGICLVGVQSDIDEVKPQIEDILIKAAYTTSRVPVQRDQLRCLSKENIALLESESGASIRLGRGRPNEPIPVEILGDDKQKQVAETRLKELLEREGVIETVQLEENETVFLLLRDRAAKLREIEEIHGGQMSIDRTTKTVKITGSRNAVDSTKEELSALDAATQAHWTSMETRMMPMDTSKFPIIIGKKGATKQQIMAQSGVAVINIIDDSGEIKIMGSAEACDIAERMINDIVNRPSGGASDTFAVDGGSPSRMRGGRGRGGGRGNFTEPQRVPTHANYTVVMASDNGGFEPIPSGRTHGHGWSSSATSHATPDSAPLNVNAAFPSLGDTLNIKTTKRNRRGRGGAHMMTADSPPSAARASAAVDAAPSAMSSTVENDDEQIHPAAENEEKIEVSESVAETSPDAENEVAPEESLEDDRAKSDKDIEHLDQTISASPGEPVLVDA